MKIGLGTNGTVVVDDGNGNPGDDTTGGHGGASFEQNLELWGLSGLPALDETTASTILTKPGEYIGITYYPPLDQIWTTYTGTNVTSGDPNDDETLIWSTKIQQ
jgi:hypothetical protein